MKAEIEDNSFSLTALDHERLFQDSLDKKLSVEHEIRRRVNDRFVSTCMILTAPTEDLRRFLQSYTADDSVFGESTTTNIRKHSD